MLGAIAGAFGDLTTFSDDVRRTLGSILRRGGTELEQMVAHQKGRITELERENSEQAQKIKELEQKNAEQAKRIGELESHSEV